MICIIDYRMGNLRSVQKGFEKVGNSAFITNKSREITKAKKLVLPGVGAFGKAIDSIHELRLRNTILKMVSDGIPLLGICLGMQLLLEKSEESNRAQGLKLIPGVVKRFQSGKKIPHIGWNQINIKKSIPLLNNIPDGSYFYFVHSYFSHPADNEHIYANTDYEEEFPSIIGRDNIYGIQFHPEKSQDLGLQILKNFAEL